MAHDAARSPSWRMPRGSLQTGPTMVVVSCGGLTRAIQGFRTRVAWTKADDTDLAAVDANQVILKPPSVETRRGVPNNTPIIEPADSYRQY